MVFEDFILKISSRRYFGGILSGFFQLDELDFPEMVVFGKHLFNLSGKFLLIIGSVLFNQHR